MGGKNEPFEKEIGDGGMCTAGWRERDTVCQ
jgi:hypothetical protein